ncbi:MAG: serine hydrolase [Bacteroidetes bacterium]|nr:MAG: serine hydrolase [Bacteroidota bacterium]
MKSGRYLIIFFAFCLSINLSFSQEKISLADLKSRIEDSLKTQSGIFALAFKDLSSNKTIFINEHTIFHAASTMKTPVLVEVYNQVNQHKISLNDSIVLKNEFTSIADGSPFTLDSAVDSEKDLYTHLGEKRSLSQLLYQMITVSSNFSTNLVIDRVGANNVTETMRKLGLRDLQVLRGVEDNKAYAKGLNNIVTAYDLMILFEKIAKGKAVNPASSKEMIKILEDQKFNEIIPAQLPANVKVAHKTGSFKGVHHDSGIVFLPNGKKYVIVILSKDLTDEEAATRMMAGISGMIYRFVVQ